MILLTILLAPLSFAVLFVVMSWTERALDHQLRCHATPTALGGGTLRDKRPEVETSVLIDQAAVR